MGPVVHCLIPHRNCRAYLLKSLIVGVLKSNYRLEAYLPCVSAHRALHGTADKAPVLKNSQNRSPLELASVLHFRSSDGHAFLPAEVNMRFKRILFPTDFSEQSDAALDYASQLAAICHAELHIIYVHDTRNPAAISGDAATYSCVLSDIDQRELQDRLATQKPRANGRCIHHFVKGVPADEILALAEGAGIDLIVMSSHGLRLDARVDGKCG